MTADAAERPLLMRAEQAAARIGGNVTANWLEEHARIGDIPHRLGPRRTPLWTEEECVRIADLFVPDERGRTPFC